MQQKVYVLNIFPKQLCNILFCLATLLGLEPALTSLIKASYHLSFAGTYDAEYSAFQSFVIKRLFVIKECKTL
jgi:hypothetical protein